MLFRSSCRISCRTSGVLRPGSWTAAERYSPRGVATTRQASGRTPAFAANFTAAVVGRPHEINGQAIYAYVTLQNGVEKSDALLKELVAHVRKEIGPIATPEVIQFADALPKTRSGKIMRRILRKIAEGSLDSLGDITTLADTSVVEALIRGRK